MIVQPTRATTAVTSRIEPAEWRASVRRIPSNGATKSWLMLRMRRDEAVGLPGVEQEQDEAGSDDDLDEPEDEDDDASGHLGAAGARLVVRRLSVRTVSWPATPTGSWVTTVRST